MDPYAAIFLWFFLLSAVPPPVSLDDLRIFPSPADVRRATKAAAENRDEMRRLPFLASEFDAAVWRCWERDAYWRWFVIDDVRIAQDESYDVAYRLAVLRRLRDWIGIEDYGNGRLPAPVPLWRSR